MSEPGVTVIDGGETNRGRSQSPSAKSDGMKMRRFQNGWSKEQETLISNWSDICTVYKFLHSRSETVFHRNALTINIIIIIISSLAGFANIGVQSLFEGNEGAIKLASFAIGGVSLLSSMLTTINNLLKFSNFEESHRVAAIGWGKFGRLASVELALNPNDRMDSLDFLKVCRAELDRLIEQSPPIPPGIIKIFEKKFGHVKDLKRPEICGNLEHTAVYQSSEDRLKKLASEAALMLRHKKQTLKELVTPEMEMRLAQQVDDRVNAAIEERKKKLEQELEARRMFDSEEEMLRAKLLEERRAKLQGELEIEKQRLEEELEKERQKAKEQEDALKEIAEERRRKIQEELELEKQKMAASAPDILQNGSRRSSSVPPAMDRMTGSSFENRLNMNRHIKGKSMRRKSLTHDRHSYILEMDATNKREPIRVHDSVSIRISSDAMGCDATNDIILINKD